MNRTRSGIAASAAVAGLFAACSSSRGGAGNGTPSGTGPDAAAAASADGGGTPSEAGPAACTPLGTNYCPSSAACCQTGADVPVGGGCIAIENGLCVPRCNSGADCASGSCCIHNSSSVPPAGFPPIEPGGWCLTAATAAQYGFGCMSGYGNGYICTGNMLTGYACVPADGGAGGGAGDAATEGGAPGGDASSASPGEAGAGCAANVTLRNVAFYGQGTATQASVCSGVAPASTAVTGNVESMLNGTIVYGSAPTAWFAYTAASTGQAKPTLTFDTATASMSAAVPVSPSADGSYAFGAVGVAFLESFTTAGTCANGSGYTGVSFDVEGDFGGCKATFIVVTSEDAPPGNGGGTCTASTCYSPSYALAQTGKIMVPFTALMGGMPQNTVDPAAIVTLQWQFTP